MHEVEQSRAGEQAHWLCWYLRAWSVVVDDDWASFFWSHYLFRPVSLVLIGMSDALHRLFIKRSVIGFGSEPDNHAICHAIMSSSVAGYVTCGGWTRQSRRRVAISTLSDLRDIRRIENQRGGQVVLWSQHQEP